MGLCDFCNHKWGLANVCSACGKKICDYHKHDISNPFCREKHYVICPDCLKKIGLKSFMRTKDEPIIGYHKTGDKNEQ